MSKQTWDIIIKIGYQSGKKIWFKPKPETGQRPCANMRTEWADGGICVHLQLGCVFFSKHKRNIGLGKNPFKPLALGIFPIAHVGFKKHFVRVKSLCKTHWIANILIGWIVAINLHYFTFKIGHMCLLSDRSKHTKCDMRHVAQRVNSIQMNTSNNPWNNIERSDFPSILWTKLKQQL